MHRSTFVLTFLLSIGCQSAPDTDAAASAEPATTSRLDEFVGLVAATVSNAANEIATSTDDFAVRRNAVLWKMVAIPDVRRMARVENPRKAFLNIWVYLYQTMAYLESGDGKALFGDQQKTAVAASRGLEDHLVSLAKAALPPDNFEEADREVREFATANPMHGSWARDGLPPSAAVAKGGAFSWVPSLSVSSLNPFGGIDEGAAAIHQFAQVADRFTDVVQALPDDTLWQLELLLYGLEASDVVAKSTDSLQAAAASVDRLSSTAQALPADIGKEVDTILTQIDSHQSDLRQTLTEARDAAEHLKGLSESLQQTFQSVTPMANSLELTLDKFKETVETLRGPPGAAPPAGASAAQPFDIREYDHAAQSITAMAAELREVLSAVDGVVGDDRISERVKEIETATRDSVANIRWNVIIAGLVLIGAACGALIFYKIVDSRAPKPRP